VKKAQRWPREKLLRIYHQQRKIVRMELSDTPEVTELPRIGGRARQREGNVGSDFWWRSAVKGEI